MRFPSTLLYIIPCESPFLVSYVVPQKKPLIGFGSAAFFGVSASAKNQQLLACFDWLNCVSITFFWGIKCPLGTANLGKMRLRDRKKGVKEGLCTRLHVPQVAPVAACSIFVTDCLTVLYICDGYSFFYNFTVCLTAFSM